jgi:hypothetical protein
MSTPSPSSDLSELTQSPADLAPAAVTALIKPSSNVSIDDLVLDIQPGGKVIITPTSLAYSNPSWPYYGHAVATFQQADLGNAFGNFEIKLAILQLPARSGDVATLLARIFDVLLSPSDVVDVPLPTILGGGTPFTLQASPNSLMWKGQREVVLFPTTVVTTDLTELILNTDLDGLTPPQPAQSFVITNPVLTDGLTLSQLQQGSGSA